MRRFPLFCLWTILVLFPARAHDNHATTSESRENLEKKIAYFEKRLQMQPHDLKHLGRLGSLYLERAKITGHHADYKLSETTFDRLLFLDANSKTGSIGSCYALMGQHRFAEALKRARRAGERLSGDPGMWALMGDLYLALGHYLEAETFYARLYHYEKTLASTARMAQIAEIRGDFRSARALYEEAVLLGETDRLSAHETAWCRTLLGDFFMKAGLLEEAEAAYQKALEEAPSMHYTPWRLGILAHRRQELDAAREWVAKAIALGPNLPQYEISMGFILSDLGQSQAAEEWFQKAERRIGTEIESGDIGHVRELAQMWLERGIHLEKALELARRDLEEVRRDVEAYELAAWAMHRNGNAQEALGWVDNSLRPGFGSARALLRAGIIYHHAGANNKARFLLNLGLNMGGYTDAKLKTEAETLVAKLKVAPNDMKERILRFQEELKKKKEAEQAGNEKDDRPR